MTACCSLVRKSATPVWPERVYRIPYSAPAPVKSARVKSQPLKYERRRSAPRSTASTNLQPVNSDALMSQPDRSVPEKSHCSKSFQHIRDSDRSVLANFTRWRSDRPKYVRGRRRALRSVSSTHVRKNENLGSSSS